MIMNNLSSCEIKAWTGFELMTSAIPVQCSTDWAIKPLGATVTLWARNEPVECEDVNEYMKDHIFEQDSNPEYFSGFNFTIA